MQRVAVILRRYPWVIAAVRHVWRLTRPRYSMGAVGVVFNDAGEVLLVEHVFHPYNPWGLPGGWIDHDEDPQEAVRRELREELGLDVEVGVVLAVRRVLRHHIDVAFLCHPVGSIGTPSYELLGYRWTPPAQLPSLYTFHQEAIERARSLMQESMRVQP
jgi:8-oxo-dGTP pyrophosphatase MutT (NUDIX family)